MCERLGWGGDSTGQHGGLPQHFWGGSARSATSTSPPPALSVCRKFSNWNDEKATIAVSGRNAAHAPPTTTTTISSQPCTP